jgi:heterodisulfide reductase subunit B
VTSKTNDRTELVLYPGCCVDAVEAGRLASAAAMALCGAIGLDLREAQEWHCCGAIEWPSRWPVGSAALAIHNLALAGKRDVDAVCLCPACAQVLQKGVRLVQQQPGLEERMAGALKELGLEMPRRMRARHILDVLGESAASDSIRGLVRKPLRGMRVCCYYGCKSDAADGAMERLLACAGATVVETRAARRCCGALEPGDSVDAAQAIMREANDKGAEAVSAACLWCVESLRRAAGPVPVFFFAQILAGALGLPIAQAGLRISREGRRTVIRARGRRPR